MANSDQLQRFVFPDANARGELVHLDASYHAVLTRHTYPPALQNLLGEALAAITLLSATLKFAGTVTLQAHGKGNVTLLMAECTHKRELRGLAKWQGQFVPTSFQEAMGEGHMVITIDPIHATQRYQGIVDCHAPTLALSLENYFKLSEQLTTKIYLASNENTAAGLLLQALPADASHDIPKEREVWEHLNFLTATITSKELLELHQQELIKRLYHAEHIELFPPESVCFKCTCSRERMESVLRGLGREEVMDIIHEHGKVDAHCEFCHQPYSFDAVDVEILFTNVTSNTRH
jgi:molecular chaperone Hsp33